PESLSHLEKTVNQIENIRVKHIEIRIPKCTGMGTLAAIMNAFENTIVRSVELFVSFDFQFDPESLLSLQENYSRLTSIVVFSHYENSEINTGNHLKTILTLTESLDNRHCGLISKDIFNPNMKHVLESFSFNTCLN